jgi:hypothetical protein
LGRLCPCRREVLIAAIDTIQPVGKGVFAADADRPAAAGFAGVFSPVGLLIASGNVGGLWA